MSLILEILEDKSKQIHVNIVFPYLTRDFWEKSQEEFFQAPTKSMPLLTADCLNIVSRPWSTIIYGTVTVIKDGWSGGQTMVTSDRESLIFRSESWNRLLKQMKDLKDLQINDFQMAYWR